MKMPSRRAMYFLVPALWLAVLASAAGAVYVKHRSRELFVELERVNRERDRLEMEWGSAATRAERLFDTRVRRERRGDQSRYAYAATEADRSGSAMTRLA